MLDIVKKVVKDHPKSFAAMILLIALSIVSSLLPPLALEQIVNHLTGQKEVSLLFALAYFGLIALADLFASAQNIAITIFGQKLTHGMRSALAQKLNTITTAYLTTHESGAIASVFVNDADTIDSLYSDGIVGMIVDLFQLVGLLFVIFTRSIGLGLIVLVVMPVILIMTRHFQKSSLASQKQNRAAIAKVNHHIPETLRVLSMVHIFEKEDYMENKYDQYIEDSYEAQNKSNWLDSVYSPIILTIEAAVIGLLMIGAAQGQKMRLLFGINAGSAVALIAYIGQIFTPLESIGMEIQSIQDAMAGMSRIRDFLNEEDTRPDLYQGEGAYITFDHVTFGYQPDQPVLKDYSFHVDKGEHVTFVGRTGKDKSTIFKLLLGLYQPQKGKILLDGHSPDLHPQNQRHFLAICEQGVALIDGTVKDQITLYDASITDEMIRKSLDMVGLTEIVKKLPEGIDTPVADINLSQGQLQLLMIARSIVCDPQILLLDEMTASLDTETEAKVLKAIDAASSGRTVLSISHRRGAHDGRLIKL
ncbi:ABC transporter ATP-binding protein [Lactobacillus nasalidis]|uniref:ABC transporter ATP-binding protein n=1 Tax=Lactobacillus nasalidis TaxID=2797258 RepID=A0ABQ3W6I1_9LACO|nr:ABC transporter ATP-binding protein [Lactobacillus nasalidis]GHV96967.1 ABC transporter ATP-binding protein [Lactobacillus nasalidis]GHV98574.1 ABC transporter ATP-binding protein [Lactobacillus nasalidis]GHW02081.1 ABC transporter ATP-binding protein [Lactobacillus nasalidis]